MKYLFIFFTITLTNIHASDNKMDDLFLKKAATSTSRVHPMKRSQKPSNVTPLTTPQPVAILSEVTTATLPKKRSPRRAASDTSLSLHGVNQSVLPPKKRSPRRSSLNATELERYVSEPAKPMMRSSSENSLLKIIFPKKPHVALNSLKEKIESVPIYSGTSDAARTEYALNH